MLGDTRVGYFAKTTVWQIKDINYDARSQLTLYDLLYGTLSHPISYRYDPFLVQLYGIRVVPMFGYFV